MCKKYDIDKVINETSMDYLQAKRHVESRNNFIATEKYRQRQAQLELEKENALLAQR